MFIIYDVTNITIKGDQKKKAEKIDIALDMKRLSELALQNDVDAQARLGRNYYFGRQVARNKLEGEKWLLLAAKHQDTNAGKWAKGICHEEGIKTPVNETAALACYQEAAEKGYTPAQTELGRFYEYGKGGLTQNPKLAFEYYQKAAKTYVSALYKVAECYEEGVGIIKDEKKALKLYQFAADQGHAYSQAKLSSCYLFGDCGVVLDKKLGLEYAFLAAEQGNAWSQHVLAECYWDGYGVQKNESVAVKFYRQAAEQDYAFSQYALGRCYKYGWGGLREDQAQAKHWLKLAAEQGHEEAREEIAAHCVIL